MLVHNLRYACRSLLRSPGFTFTVVLTFALAIGANGAVFSALDAVLFKPLPFPNGDRLMRLTQSQGDGPPSGTRTLPDGSTIDLTQALNVANCDHVAPCTAAEMDANTGMRPWASNNPRWQLYAYGKLTDMLPVSDTIKEADGSGRADVTVVQPAANGRFSNCWSAAASGFATVFSPTTGSVSACSYADAAFGTHINDPQ